MVVDVVIFTLRPEVGEEALVRAATDAAAAFTASGGLLSRTLSRDGDGQWIDIVEWETTEDASRAWLACADDAGLKAFEAAKAPGAIAMRHVIAPDGPAL